MMIFEKSNVDGVSNFYSWLDEVGLDKGFWKSPIAAARLAYMAGEQSKQEQINRLNEALKYMLEQLDHPYRTSGERVEKEVNSILKKR